jgi:hypothetical protein
MTRETTRVALVLAAEAVVMAGLLLVAADLWAHVKTQDVGGVNIWGYRGAVARRRQPGEIRVVIVGGTRAFAWGTPGTALTSELRRMIMFTTDRPGQPLRPVVAIDLARLGALPDTYRATLTRFAYLRPDYVCLYDDLGERGAVYDPRASGVYAMTGYQPILPLVVREKGMRLTFGSVAAGYAAASNAVASREPLLRRIAGGTLELGGGVLAAADRLPAHALVRAPRAVDDSPAGYVADMLSAIDVAHREARGVIVVLSPADTPAQAARRGALLDRLHVLDLTGSSWLRLVDLGADPALAGPDLRLDGWNFTSAGVQRVAQLVAPPLVDFITRP